MFQSHFGEIAALLTAIFWTITAMVFEVAGKRVGAMTVNIVRLFIAFFIYTVYLYFTRGLAFPTDASGETWFWLVLSGLVGFVIGDQFLFRAFVMVGARISMLVMAFVPPITAMLGWIILGETLTLLNVLGMILTISGVSLVVLKREVGNDKVPGGRKLKFSYPLVGILLAFGGAVGQSVGLVLSKFGMKDYNAFAASQIRVLAGLIGFAVLFSIQGNWNVVFKGLKDRKGMINLSVGSVFGPFLGVSFSLLAIQYTTTGIASTIMAIIPILIIPPAVIFFKEKVNKKEVIGAMIAVAGVVLFFVE
ncbi:MAG: DMT family transporter [Chlorobi bacterium]|nr:DMT family transporter [Chlorobiota bacterium]